MAEKFPDFKLAKRVIITIDYEDDSKNKLCDYFLEIISDIGVMYRTKYASYNYSKASYYDINEEDSKISHFDDMKSTKLISNGLLRLTIVHKAKF
jgi:hypothetical protein